MQRHSDELQDIVLQTLERWENVPLLLLINTAFLIWWSIRMELKLVVNTLFVFFLYQYLSPHPGQRQIASVPTAENGIDGTASVGERSSYKYPTIPSESHKC